MSWLARFSVQNRWVTMALAAVVVGVSVWVTVNLKMELIPDIQPPVVTVIAQSPGSLPEQVVEHVAIPIEEKLEGMAGLQHIQSTSMSNMCYLILTFDYSVDIDKTTAEVQQRVGELGLPSEPYVMALSMDMVPVVMLGLFGGDMSTRELRGLAEENIVPVLSEVEGLLPPEKETPLAQSISVLGGEERAGVVLDLDSLNQASIPPAWVVQTIISQESYDSPEEIAEMPLLGDPSLPSVGSFAQVSPPVYITRSDGQPGVGLMLYKDPDANTVDVANAIVEKVDELEDTLPEGVRLSVIFDQAEYIEESISGLTRDTIIGALLAAVVVFIFMWAVRPSLIVVLTIPVSIVVSFLIMYFTGITINLLTLSGLAVAVGRIVDDAIVVVEVIYRHLQQGEPFKTAAIEGTREVAGAVTSATIATVAIFIPLIFVGGLVGELFQPFALTVTFALLLSLFTALTLVPALSGFMGVKPASAGVPANHEAGYQRLYASSLRWALRHRALVVSVAVVLFVGSFGLIPVIGTSFLPPMMQPMMLVTVEMPEADQVTLDQKVKLVENEMLDLGVSDFYTIMGNPFSGVPISGNNTAMIISVLDSDEEADRLVQQVRENCLPLEDEATTITVSSGEALMAQMTGAGNVVSLSVMGTELTEVDQATGELAQALSGLEEEGMLSDVSRSSVFGGRSPVIVPDPQKIVALGLDPDAVSQELALLNYGYPLPVSDPGVTLPVPTVVIEDHEFGISIPSVVNQAEDASDLANIRIWGRTSAQPAQPVRLGDIVATDIAWGPASYFRSDGEYSGTVSATIAQKDVGAVNRHIVDLSAQIEEEYPGVRVQAGGVTEQMQTTFQDMLIAILVAIAICYLIVAIGTRSPLNALIILLTLPLAFIGAFLALLISGHTLGASALIGFLMLVGIVLSNAIVLISRIEQVRNKMSIEEAVVEASSVRLRPILMTALTTMLALVPLAIGLYSSALIASELGVVVIGGLFSSTALTLIVVPVVYAMTHRDKDEKAGLP